ncbi:MAG: PKD domain-containing protein [Gemmataceae bacterium]|nr:PKD domain-containing protein [Gemmataceae bacterium]
MSEEKPEGVKKTLSGWLKAAITSVVGLVSGAVIMYLTPVVNNVIKPAKPVANFATHATDLTVEFNNRSTGAVLGWWDFGDGTALEPFDPKTENLKHVYPKAGTYTVKLALQNLLGDASERSTSVVIEADSALKPEIETFELKPFTPGECAPAIYKLISKTKLANYCILSVGDDRPMEIIDGAGDQVRYVAFKEMGAYTVRLAAVNGRDVVEKTKTVYVGGSDGSEPTAKLAVTYEAVRVQRFEREVRIYCGWHPDAKENVLAVRKERPIESGCTIVSVELVNKNDKNALARKFEVQPSPDKSKIILTGELVKPSGLLTPKTAPPHWVAQVKVVMERRSPLEIINRGEVMMAVNPGTTTKIPMQPLEPGYDIIRKHVNLELWDSGRKVWEGSKAVTNAKVMLKNQPCLVTAIPQADGMLLKIDAGNVGTVTIPTTPSLPVGPVIRPTGFERNPLLPRKF